MEYRKKRLPYDGFPVVDYFAVVSAISFTKFGVRNKGKNVELGITPIIEEIGQLLQSISNEGNL
jgi:hypothetical protein